jgi:beta-glucosidase
LTRHRIIENVEALRDKYGRIAVEPFRDPKLSFDERADDLLARLTSAERVAMLHQRSPSVERLGLDEWHTGQEALHGAAWRGEATVFPQAIGLGATWDPPLVQRVGEAAAREVLAKPASRNVWAPVVNLLRDPRWGRNEEGYSEDPLLTAVLATAYCRGLRDDDPDGYLRTAPTLKHFVAHNNEACRDTSSSSVRPRVLNEYDIRPFRDPVMAGVVSGIMPAYNLVNGRPNHVSPLLNQTRAWTGEDLLISSDAWAPSNLVDTEHYFASHPEAHAAALHAGLDSFTDHDGDGAFTVAQLTAALDRDLITMADVDRAVRRKLLVRLRLGEFDPDGGPFAGDAALLTSAHRRTAREAATRSPVLLRNDDRLLPLTPGVSVAVVGPLACDLFEDWYSGTLPYKVTVADGLAAVADVTAVPALDRVDVGDLGVFDVADWGGNVVTLRAAPPQPTSPDRPPGLYLTSDFTVSSPGPHGWTVHETFIRAGDRLRSTATDAEAVVSWTLLSDGVASAARAAASADIAVVVVGNHPLINGRETQDRTTLEFPPRQRDLIRAVMSANPRTVLVIMSSYPYAVPPEVKTVLWTSHGGQETGNAIADLLTGAEAPSGRLPQTWYASDADLPDILEYDIIKARRTYQYFDGAPLFPFGHGLTYTTFQYSNLRVERDESLVTVRVDVTNTGPRPASEVIQLYTHRAPAAVDRVRDWPRRLAGFTRLTLTPGQTGTAEISFPLTELAIWDVDTGLMKVFGGSYTLDIGASSADTRQTATLTVDGPAPGSRRLTGRLIRAADFDDQENIILVDETRADGDAVTPAAHTGTLVFRHARLGSANQITLCVAGEPGTIEVRHGDEPLATLDVAPPGGKYAWQEVTTTVTSPGDDPRDLSLVLTAGLRLAWFRLSAQGHGRQANWPGV